jgi:TIR domain
MGVLMVDVFVSYSHEDRDRCQRFVDDLLRLKVGVWFDERLGPGQGITDQVEEALDRAKAVVVLWTKSSVKSEWVKAEANRGKSRNILVTIRLEECSVPFYFDNHLYLDLFPANSDQLEKTWLSVLERIGKIIDRPGLRSYVEAGSRARSVIDDWRRLNPNDPLARLAQQNSISSNSQASPAPAVNVGRRAVALASIVSFALVGTGGALGWIAAQVASQPGENVEQGFFLGGHLLGTWGYTMVCDQHIELRIRGNALIVSESNVDVSIEEVTSVLPPTQLRTTRGDGTEVSYSSESDVLTVAGDGMEQEFYRCPPLG